MLLAVPRYLRLGDAASFVHTLQKWSARGELTIDFTNIAWVYPAGTVCLAVGMRRWLAERNEAGLATEFRIDFARSAGCGYLGAFGFFDLIGHSAPAAPTLARSNANFLTLTLIQRELVSFEGVPAQQKLDEMSFVLSKQLMHIRDPGHPMVQAVSYSMREAIRNVFEHARTDEAIVMAQRWANGRAEIALGDSGIGIHASLSQVHAPRDATHALEMAVLPGITEYVGPETRSPWQNSGYGLFMLSEAGRNFGHFELASSGRLLGIRPGNRVRQVTDANGLTVVGLQLNVNDDYYFNNFLDRTKTEGERIAVTIRGARKHASKASGGAWH